MQNLDSGKAWKQYYSLTIYVNGYFINFSSHHHGNRLIFSHYWDRIGVCLAVNEDQDKWLPSMLGVLSHYFWTWPFHSTRRRGIGFSRGKKKINTTDLVWHLSTEITELPLGLIPWPSLQHFLPRKRACESSTIELWSLYSNPFFTLACSTKTELGKTSEKAKHDGKS